MSWENLTINTLGQILQGRLH